MKNNVKELKAIAQFYNEYQVINFRDQNELKSQGKVFTKQMEELVNDVLPALIRIVKKDSKELPKGYDELGMQGIVLSTLMTNNLVAGEKFNKVQKNLEEVKKLAEGLGFDKKLVKVLEILVP